MERWKDIPGYEGIYEASNCGRIRTAKGKTTFSKLHGIRHWEQRVLKQKYESRKGGEKKDARVMLWKDGKESTYLVSRLVAMTWCDGSQRELTVNHIDGNPTNNRAENLEWVTRAENIRHGFETGLFPQKCVTVTDANGGVFEFQSMASASRYLGRNDGYVSGLIAKGKTKTPQGYSISVNT